MARRARIDAPGALHHITGRGIERRKIFQNDIDRDDFIDRLGKILPETETSCYAWALMPNHFHLLLRTGKVPIATVMRRLLTGYVVSFNRRYNRSGHLFQNRYKSILCQENPYFKELIRYIHLNPLRADVVITIDGLDGYRYCGHSHLMGKAENSWQSADAVLAMFGYNNKAYRQFIEMGIAKGRRPELTGGGLVRSAGGWQKLKNIQQMQQPLKGDERILGDSDYVESVLKSAGEDLAEKWRLKAKNFDFDYLLERVSQLRDIPVDLILQPSREPQRVTARSLAAYWAVRKLNMSGTQVGRKLGICQSAVSRAVRRGEKLALDNELFLEK